MDSSFQRIVSWWLPARMPLPGAANVHPRSTCPEDWPGSLWKTSAKEEELRVPPTPPFVPRLFHDTFATGMLEPLGGVNAAASDCTLTRRALPEFRFAFEKLIVVTFGVALVLRLTSVTGKLIASGTEMLAVSCAPADTTAAPDTAMVSTVIRMASDPPHEKRLT